MKVFAVIALVLMLAMATECTRLSFNLPNAEEVVVNYEAENSGSREANAICKDPVLERILLCFPGDSSDCRAFCKAKGKYTGGVCRGSSCFCTYPCVFDPLIKNAVTV